MDLVSIIIPVYNVGQFIDQCLQSVTEQSYNHLEILIIYDLSKDDSYEKCAAWAERDPRICLIQNQRRNGLGAARNQALKYATGKYVLFLDADDWVTQDCVEGLYNEIVRSQADYVSASDYYEVQDEQVLMRHGLPQGIYDSEEMKQVLLAADWVTMWKKLYRRDWLLGNRLFQPELFHYEDWGTYPMMVGRAAKISVLAKSGFYYRAAREGCLSFDNSLSLVNDFRKVLVWMLDHLKQADIFEKYREVIAYYCLRGYFMYWRVYEKRGDMEIMSLFQAAKREILDANLGEYDPDRTEYIAFGSFSLRWEVQQGIIIEEKLRHHYCFSSLISAMSKNPKGEVSNENGFRREQIEYDMQGAFIEQLERANDNTLLFIDFLEERHPILELEDGSFITQSDAFLESDIGRLPKGRVIESRTAKFMNLWKDSCRQFMKILKQKLKPEQIILVCNGMASGYGDFTKQEKYDNWRELEDTNEMLAEMERFFLSEMEGVTVLRAHPEYDFTDPQFRLGCRPEYKNQFYYSYMACKVNKIVRNFQGRYTV